MSAAQEPAGLVLGRRVYVARVGDDLAYRGKVAGLDPVEVRLDRVKWSDTFHAGDQVRTAHPGRAAAEAVVVGAAHGTLVLLLLTKEGR